ncbi:MAG: MFS transporter [Pyrinomonadaceae bacterium]
MSSNNLSAAAAPQETFQSRFFHTFRALKHRNYQYFTAGQIVSLCGTWMQTVAESWLVYRLTGSAALLGMVGFSSQIPVFLIAPFGGAFADRANRRRILMMTQGSAMLLAFGYAFLTLTGRIQVWEIFVIAVLLGLVNAFDIPTRQAFVTDLVGKEDLINAIALNSSMFNGARIIGPAIAGILVAAVGEGWCFFINALSYIAVLTGLFMIKVESKPRLSNVSIFAGITEGFQYVWHTKPILSLMALLAVISLMGMPYAVLMPVFAKEILHGGASSLGLLMGASGCGALIGALSLASRKGIKGLGSWVAFASSGFGIAIILFSFSHYFWLSAALLVPAGFSMMIQMASSNTLVQSLVPDDLRGRVMAVYSMMFMGMAPFGALLAGTLAGHIGAPFTVAIGGVVCILGSIGFALKLPNFRIEARRVIVALQMTAGEPPHETTVSKDTLLTPQKAYAQLHESQGS